MPHSEPKYDVFLSHPGERLQGLAACRPARRDPFRSGQQGPPADPDPPEPRAVTLRRFPKASSRMHTHHTHTWVPRATTLLPGSVQSGKMPQNRATPIDSPGGPLWCRETRSVGHRFAQARRLPRACSAAGAALGESRRVTRCVLSVAFSPDGQSLASASRDGSVRLWSVAEGREVRQEISRYLPLKADTG